jgi:drug/metabolite transporter (DMT)-like permease
LLPGLIPFFVIILGALINRETVSKTRSLGLSSICLGIALLFFLQHATGDKNNSGDLWFIGGAFCWGLFSILIKRWNISPWQATVSLSVFTCALYLPVYLLWLPSALSLEIWPDIVLQSVYQGVLATIIQMYLYVKAVQMLGAATMGSLMAIVPVVSGTAALFLFNEDASVGFFSGLLFVSVGVWFSHSQKIPEIQINTQEKVPCPTSISK